MAEGVALWQLTTMCFNDFPCDSLLVFVMNTNLYLDICLLLQKLYLHVLESWEDKNKRLEQDMCTTTTTSNMHNVLNNYFFPRFEILRRVFKTKIKVLDV